MKSLGFLTVIFFALLGTARAETTQKYYIEGIVYDPVRPENSIAVINGQSYRKNSRLGAYVVEDIYANGVLLKHAETGEDRTLMVARDSPPRPELATEVGGGWRERLSSFFNGGQTGGSFLDFLPPVRMAKETAVQVAIMKIRTALLAYRAETDQYPVTLDLLVEGGLLETVQLDTTRGYRFSYTVAHGGFTLHAEPETASAKKRYFYLNEDGVMRAEQGEPAGPGSPLVSSL